MEIRFPLFAIIVGRLCSTTMCDKLYRREGVYIARIPEAELLDVKSSFWTILALLYVRNYRVADPLALMSTISSIVPPAMEAHMVFKCVLACQHHVSRLRELREAEATMCKAIC